jgi:energy-coupling factor transporter ATP-binding protein EcfA2
LRAPIPLCFAGRNEANLDGLGAASPDSWAVEIRGLWFTFPSPLPGGEPIPALCGIDLAVEHGECVAVMGPVGAGKSSLCYAINGAIPHAIDGAYQGEVIVLGQDVRHVSMGQLALQVGLVFEDVEAQLFSASVADEVAFGLESMGLPSDEIERRIDESLDLVGLSGFRHRAPRTLSGGEQKRLALASVLAMQPTILVLDEPTMGLDPLARKHVLQAITRMRQDKGRSMTVLMATQDAEIAAQFADRIVVLREGRVMLSGRPEQLFVQGDQMRDVGARIPQLARLAQALAERTRSALFFVSPEDAQAALAGQIDVPSPRAHGTLVAEPPLPSEPLVEIRGLGYRYPAADRWALRECTLDIQRGEWLAVIGVNGAGKSTLIRHLNGLLKPAEGTVCVGGRDTRTCQVGELARTIAYLPQNPDHMIFTASVRQEVASGPRQLGFKGVALDRHVADALELLDLGPYVEHPPAVLGYGLRRKVVLAGVLAMDTPILALDEPTVGLDEELLVRLMDAIELRHRQGMTVVMITHDLSWVARYAQRVAVLSEGRLVQVGSVSRVLADIEGLASAHLEPLPVTALAGMLGWPPPLPLDVEGFLSEMSGG